MTSRLIIVVAGAFALIVYCSFYFGRVTFGVDTTTYLQWHPWVPLGYPMFLSAIRNTLGLRWAGLIQMSLLVGVCTFVGLAVQRLTGRWITGAVTLLLLLCHTEVFHLQGVLFSEALFTPLLLANIGAAIFFIATRSSAFAILVTVTAASAMFVRPAGYFLAAGVFFIVICHWSRRAAWLAVPFLALIVGTFAINSAIRGGPSQSQIGRVLFPHVAFSFDPSVSSNRVIAEAIEGVMTTRRAEYAAQPDRTARVIYSMFDYNKRIHAFELALEAACKSNPPCASNEKMMLDLFLVTVKSRPAEYAELIFDGLIEAWRGTILAPWSGFVNVYRAEASLHPKRVEQLKNDGLPLTPDDIRLAPELTTEWQGAVIHYLDSIRVFISKQRWILYAVGLASLAAMLAAPFAKRWQALGYCGVMIHGSMLLIAASTVFIPRYALPIDPVILVAGVIMMDGLLAWAFTATRTGFRVYRGRTAV